MSNLHSTTCAFYMQLDILYKIFQILIEENEDLRLIILRHGSQVCASWRELLLSSPSLWGMSLDFDVLMAKPAWRDEVIHRSGESYAYITRLNGYRTFYKGEELFLGSFIKNNWQRTKSLRIVLPVEAVVTGIFDISLLQSPHLHLEELEVLEHHGCIREEGSSIPSTFYALVKGTTFSVDFGGHAPRLRRYKTGPTLQFPYQTSSLRQLRELQGAINDCFIPNILDGLRNMMSLEHLELTLDQFRIAHPDARARVSNTPLPRLKYLEIKAYGPTIESVDLVNYINPAAGCIMQVELHFWDGLPDSDISSTVRAVSAFPLDDCGEAGKDEQGRIGIYDCELRIGNPRHQLLLRGPLESNFWTHCFHHFVASPDFCTATSIHLTLRKEVMDTIPSAYRTMAQILSNMTSVAHISLDWVTLDVLLQLYVDDEANSECRNTLPALESIALFVSLPDLNDLEAWLDCRATHDVKPLKRVDICWYPQEDHSTSLEGFQRFTNLEVKLHDLRRGGFTWP